MEARHIQQFISDDPHMKYLKVLKATWMPSDNRKDLVEWAQKYMKKDQEFWSSIIFSNENRFCPDSSDGYAHYLADTLLESDTFLLELEMLKDSWYRLRSVRKVSQKFCS